jgi:hypothetical protein
VRDRQFAAPVRRSHDGGELLFGERRELVLVHDLDIVGALGDARIHECLRVVVRAESRQGHTGRQHLGRVTLRSCHAISGHAKIGGVRIVGRAEFHQQFHVARVHVELRCDTQGRGLPQGIGVMPSRTVTVCARTMR